MDFDAADFLAGLFDAPAMPLGTGPGGPEPPAGGPDQASPPKMAPGEPSLAPGTRVHTTEHAGSAAEESCLACQTGENAPEASPFAGWGTLSAVRAAGFRAVATAGRTGGKDSGADPRGVRPLGWGRVAGGIAGSRAPTRQRRRDGGPAAPVPPT